jgi:hypothetical protein
MALLGRLVKSNVAEVQMQLRRIHSPTQQRKKERRQTGKRRKSGKDLAEPTRK